MADTPETPLFKCKTCSTAFSGIIPYRDHMKSKKHAERVRNKSYEAEVGKDGEIIASNGDNTDETSTKKSQFRCDDCNKDFSGPIPYVQHVNGQGHYRVLRNKILSETAMSLTSSINSLIQHDVAAEEGSSDKNAHQEDVHKPQDDHDSVPEPKINETAEKNAEAPAPVSKAVAKVTPEKSGKKKAEALQTSSADNNKARAPQQLNFNPNDLRCDLCNMRSFMSVHDMMLHFESDAHRFNRMQQQVRHLEELSLNNEQNGSASSNNSSMEKIDYDDVAE